MRHGTASAILDAEHEAILHLLEAADGMIAQLETGRKVPRADVESMLDVIVGFADRCHHAKEEKVLFAALRDHGQTAALRLVRELEGDHRAARKLVASMRLQADAGESGDARRARQLAHDARLYAKVLRAHIDHEQALLLPAADALPPIVAERVAAEFARIEDEEIGAGTHERYEAMIRALHTRYAAKGSSSSMLSHHH